MGTAPRAGSRYGSRIPLYEAEGERFELSIRLTTDNGFRDRRIRPLCHPSSGEGGIRTLDAGIHPHNALAGRRLQPLGHFSGFPHGIERLFGAPDLSPFRMTSRSPFRGMPQSGRRGMLSEPDLPSHTPPAWRRPLRSASPFL